MATTMSLIAKQTVGSGGAASVTFSNIPQTFTDLKVVASVRNSAGTNAWDDIYVDINGSSSNFTTRVLYGTGSAASSNNFATSIAQVGEGNGGTASTFGNTEIYFPNYLSTTTAKSFSADSVSENNATASLTQLGVGLWNPGTQAAISSLTFRPFTSGNFVQYSTFYLYGISNSSTQNTSVPLAYGGDVITTDGTYWYHAFINSGSFVPQKNLTTDVMSVGGGGGGGCFGGGGGGGELDLFSSQSLTSSTTYAVTIGAGGAGSTSYGSAGTTGSTSSFSSLVSSLGGGGGGRDGNNGLAGGSGGGGGKSGTGGSASGSNTNAGGNGGGADAGVAAMGGGGGATAAGTAGTSIANNIATGGTGGQGYALSNISGLTSALSGVFSGMTRISSGGGGGAFTIDSAANAPVMGAGGTGAGNGGYARQSSSPLVAPTASTSYGSGGGGSGSSSGGTSLGNGTNGYQGIIIVRYAV